MLPSLSSKIEEWAELKRGGKDPVSCKAEARNYKSKAFYMLVWLLSEFFLLWILKQKERSKQVSSSEGAYKIRLFSVSCLPES